MPEAARAVVVVAVAARATAAEAAAARAVVAVETVGFQGNHLDNILHIRIPLSKEFFR
jgi:hypothetical protein